MTKDEALEAMRKLLAGIGPRELTDQEAKQLHILRIRAGKVRVGNVVGKLLEMADAEASHKPPAAPDQNQ